MIPQSHIIQALHRFRYCFDRSLTEEEMNDIIKKIAADICGAPVIQPAKWLSFTKVGQSPSGKTSIYQVRQKQEPHALLGEIKWHPAFRSYSFFTMPDIIYEPQCLTDITLFIEAIMHLHLPPKNEKQPAFVGTAALPGYEGATAVGHESSKTDPMQIIGHSAGMSTSDPAAKKISIDNDSKKL